MASKFLHSFPGSSTKEDNTSRHCFSSGKKTNLPFSFKKTLHSVNVRRAHLRSLTETSFATCFFWSAMNISTFPKYFATHLITQTLFLPPNEILPFFHNLLKGSIISSLKSSWISPHSVSWGSLYCMQLYSAFTTCVYLSVSPSSTVVLNCSRPLPRTDNTTPPFRDHSILRSY